jgi:MFS family permease
MTLPDTSNKGKKPFTARQWRALIAGFALMLLSGLVNGWSIFAESIESDLRLSRQDTALVFTISLSVSIGGQILAGALNRRVQSRYIYWLIIAFSFIGFFGASMAKGIWSVYLFYGVFSGLAIGMIYNLTLTGVAAQFESDANLISGVLLMGFGVGPLALGMAAAMSMDVIGWRGVFAALAALYAVLLLGASSLIPSRKSQDAAAKGVGGATTWRMLKSRPYHYFFLWCVALGAATLILIGHSSLISRDIGASFAVASLMTGVVSVASGASRPIFGRVADLHGGAVLKNILTACCALGSAAALVGYVTGALWPLAIGYLLLGAAHGGHAVYICDFVQEKYGGAYYGMNMAVTNIYMILGSTLGAALAGAIKTQTGQYSLAFAVMLVFSAFSVLFSLLLDKTRRGEPVSRPAKELEEERYAEQ